MTLTAVESWEQYRHGCGYLLLKLFPQAQVFHSLRQMEQTEASVLSIEYDMHQNEIKEYYDNTRNCIEKILLPCELLKHVSYGNSYIRQKKDGRDQARDVTLNGQRLYDMHQ